MEKNSKTLVVVLITLLLCAVGFSIYLIMTNNQTNNNNLTTNTEENKTIENNNAEKVNKVESNDESINDLVEVFKDLIFASNADLKNQQYSGVDSELTDVDILKIDKLFQNGEFIRYEVTAKYLCDNGGWHCVYCRV